jgi:hypothetical protein
MQLRESTNELTGVAEMLRSRCCRQVALTQPSKFSIKDSGLRTEIKPRVPPESTRLWFHRVSGTG